MQIERNWIRRKKKKILFHVAEVAKLQRKKKKENKRICMFNVERDQLILTLFFPFCTVAMELRTDMPRNMKSVRHRSSKPPGHFPCKSKQSYFEKSVCFRTVYSIKLACHLRFGIIIERDCRTRSQVV